MIDVDVVKDVDEDYARDVHGVPGAQVDCFALGFISEGSDKVFLPKPIRKSNIAVSFTQPLADFFFEFAELHFRCNAGDEILLLATKMDLSEMDEDSLLTSFAERANEPVSAGHCIVIKRRPAVASGSDKLRRKLVQDIYSYSASNPSKPVAIN